MKKTLIGAIFLLSATLADIGIFISSSIPCYRIKRMEDIRSKVSFIENKFLRILKGKIGFVP